MPNQGWHHSPESKAKIAAKLKGRPHTKERREKQKGHPGYWTGKKMPEETRRKMSEAHQGQVCPLKGKHHSEETKQKISDSCKGKAGVPKGTIPWNFGKPHSQQTKAKLSILASKRTGSHNPFYGKRHKPETIAILREKLSLENHPNWRGGKSFGEYCHLWYGSQGRDLRLRVRAFFGFKCIICRKQENENFTKAGKLIRLHVHHVFFNKDACCDGKPAGWLFAPLCNSHHSKATRDPNTYIPQLRDLIIQKYGGYSYFLKGTPNLKDPFDEI